MSSGIFLCHSSILASATFTFDSNPVFIHELQSNFSVYLHLSKKSIETGN